jgi:hypothetical protein
MSSPPEETFSSFSPAAAGVLWHAREHAVSLEETPLAPPESLLAALFQASDWFGIPRRRRWSSLLREGRWALFLAAVFELAPLLLLTMYPPE